MAFPTSWTAIIPARPIGTKRNPIVHGQSCRRSICVKCTLLRVILHSPHCFSPRLSWRCWLLCGGSHAVEHECRVHHLDQGCLQGGNSQPQNNSRHSKTRIPERTSVSQGFAILVRSTTFFLGGLVLVKGYVSCRKTRSEQEQLHLR